MIDKLINQDQMDEHVIISNIMDYVGFETDEKTHIIEDKDLFTPIAMEGKTLKYSKNDYVPIDYSREAFFNPFRNYSMAKFTFLHMLYKLEQSGKFYSPLHDIEYNKEDNRLKRLIVFDENYNKIMTEFYYNTNFIYLEMIYKLSGDDTTFKEIDIPY
mgnify:CR=1 FL=1